MTLVEDVALAGLDKKDDACLVADGRGAVGGVRGAEAGGETLC